MIKISVHLFLLLIILIIYCGGGKVYASDQLVGYWKFDEGTGGSPADSSGENVSGSFTSTAPTWSTDVPSTIFTNPYSLKFEGTGDGVIIAWPSGLNFSTTSPRTFSFWYKPTANSETAASNYGRLISWTGDGFEISGTVNGVSNHKLGYNDGSWKDTGFSFSLNTWYNIIVMYDGTTVKAYVNGDQKYSAGSSGRATSGNMYIGVRHTGNEGINGLIDDVRVYSRALTTSEIADIAGGGYGPGVAAPRSNPASAGKSSPSVQIPQQSVGGFAGVFGPAVGTETGLQKVLTIIQPNTFEFDAFFYSAATKPIHVASNNSYVFSDPVTGVSPDSMSRNKNFVVAGDLIGVKTINGILWQVGHIQNMWYKAYAPEYNTDNAAKIIPELQHKPSIITLSYTDLDLIPAGQPQAKFNAHSLKLAHSVDGIIWNILPSSVVDPTNKTVAAVEKVGGYYVIVGK